MYKKYLKRLIDITISFIGIIVLFPVYIIMSLIILIGIGQPVLFSQERVGKNEKVFKLCKFRSMTNAKDDQGNLLSEELRLTKLGIFLRSTSLDELPELFNILIGNMSIIGPRPLPTYYMPYYYENEKKRHMVRGGLIPPDGLSMKTTPKWEEQFKYDIQYVDNCSFKLDMKVLFATFKILFKRVENNYGAENRPHLNVYRSALHDEDKELQMIQQRVILRKEGRLMNEELAKKLIVKYGSPLYVFNSSEFIDNYNNLLNTFREVYPKYNIAYSYKTNYTPLICQLVKKLGGYAEVVSDMEYELAKKIGYENQNIIFNGPYKGEKAVEHLLNNGLLHVDNLSEIKKICDIAKLNTDKTLSISIRVNIDIGQKFISRFGIDADSNDLSTAFKLLRSVKNIEIVGLHCHVGRSRSVDAWEKRSKIMLSLVDKFFEKPPQYIDLGSGMSSRMTPELAIQFGDNIPNYLDYCKVTAERFKEHYKNLSDEDKPMLITEPGTTLISSYVDFICEVDSIKNIKGQSFAILNCSKDNLGDICQLKKMPNIIFNTNGEYHEKVNFVGYTCLEHDVIYKEFTGNIAQGDLILFKNVGGYSNVSKPPFILPNCPMISMDSDEKTHLMKRRETFDDVFATYQF